MADTCGEPLIRLVASRGMTTGGMLAPALSPYAHRLGLAHGCRRLCLCGIDRPRIRGQSLGMEWLVEFEGEQRPLQTIWTDEAARIVGPLQATVEKALGRAADPEELEGLIVIVYAEETDTGAEWGFKFSGPPAAVNYAISLVGRTSPIIDPLN